MYRSFRSRKSTLTSKLLKIFHALYGHPDYFVTDDGFCNGCLSQLKETP